MNLIKSHSIQTWNVSNFKQKEPSVFAVELWMPNAKRLTSNFVFTFKMRI